MEDKINEFLLLYPGLYSGETKSNQICFKGTVKIKVKGVQLRVQQLHQYKTLTEGCDGFQPEWSLSDFIDNLPDLLAVPNKSLQPSHTAIDTSIPRAQCNIYAEIADLYAPDVYQTHVNSACTRVRFCKFAHYEQHYLELELPSLKLISHSLPDCVSWKELFQKCSSLTMVVLQFQKHLEDLRYFYENFVDIDELCYVVHPSPPTTKDNCRLFLLRERVFLKLLIADPFAPISSMSVHILGPTQDVEQLRRSFSDGLRDWDGELDIHKNLLRIFDLCFFPMPPGPVGEETDMTQQYCNICYCYQLERGEIPIISCDNPYCKLIFHAACLKEWFNTLSDGKIFLDVSLGSCPSCKAKLSTSFAELLEN